MGTPMDLTIDNDRPCAACGYNLRGLSLRGQCPECGLPVAAEQTARLLDDPLSLMPIHVIRVFRRGCWLASLTVVVFLGLMVSRWWGNWLPWAWSSVLLTAAVLWALAAWLVTPAFELRQAVLRGFATGSRLRQAARWLQLGWVVAAATGLVQAVRPGSGGAGLLYAGAAIGIGLGAVGGVALAVMLQRLAEWVRDDRAERALNLAVWGVPLATLLLLVPLHLPMIGILVSVLWLLAVGCLPYGLLSLSQSVTLSVMHAREHQDRERRRYQRDAEFSQRITDTLARIDQSREARAQRGEPR